jgi:hypothetical protein
MYNCYFSITIHWPYCIHCNIRQFQLRQFRTESFSFKFDKKSERYTIELGLIQFNIISRFGHAKVAERKVLIYAINNIIIRILF